MSSFHFPHRLTWSHLILIQIAKDNKKKGQLSKDNTIFLKAGLKNKRPVGCPKQVYKNHVIVEYLSVLTLGFTQEDQN